LPPAFADVMTAVCDVTTLDGGDDVIEMDWSACGGRPLSFGKMAIAGVGVAVDMHDISAKRAVYISVVLIVARKQPADKLTHSQLLSRLKYCRRLKHNCCIPDAL
jgi:hypothetical protein